MNIGHNHALVDKLAAEYALGTLRGGARRRFESLMQEDAAMRRAVAEWKNRLHPLAEFVPEVQPPERVWLALERRLDLRTATRRMPDSFWRRLRDDLGFWRGLGMASTALATVLLAVMLVRLPDLAAPAVSYVAMLADDKAQPVALVTGDPGRRRLTVKLVSPQTVAADKSLELWAVPKDGPPRSLGLLAADAGVSLALPENASPDSVPLLAVTLEPKGGSPNPSGPTGPIVFKGPWLRI